MRKIVVGVGNPYMGDDAVGLKAAEIAGQIYGVDVALLHTTSLRLVDAIEGYDLAIIVDSMIGDKPGRVHVFGMEDLELQNMALTHSMSLADALRIGAEFAEMPEVTVVAVEVQKFSGEMSEDVQRALKMVLDVIGYEVCYR